MNNEPDNTDEARLRSLLREARPAPPLPPRFREAVWRRIEHEDAGTSAAAPLAWMDALAEWLLRPRLAWAAISATLLAGVILGVSAGMSAAKREAQFRYVAAVSPLP